MPPELKYHKQGLPPVVEAMTESGFYPHPAAEIELKQTHTSYVLLAGEFAYKIRKAVRFPFIDCSSVERRRELCESELRLNRRLSPNVYLAVLPIMRFNGRYVLGESTGRHDAGAAEFALKMLRLPDDHRLDVMILRGDATTQNIRLVAKTVGSFHSRAPDVNSWKYGSAANIWRMTVANLAEIEQLVTDTSIESKLAVIEAYSRRFIAAHWELLNSRARAGHVREGHGDLRADSVYFTSGGIRITDCLEFDERLRYGDIANEVGFLAMDLDSLGRPDLSDELVAYFAEDIDAGILLPFYKSYRATVRAKVEYLRSRQPDCPDDERSTARAKALRYIALALACQQGPKALLVVCGASGTGKSTLARKLNQHFGFVVFNSDSERKRIVGIEPTTRAPSSYKQGIYTPEVTTRVYDALANEASGMLKSGKGVILDATFNSRKQRRLIADIAEPARVAPFFIECRADRAEVMRRLSERAKDPVQISDASAEVYLAQLDEFEPLSDVARDRHIIVDTGGELAPAILEIERRVYSQARATRS